MIWGKTTEQKRRERSNRKREIVFAWIPVDLEDGRFALLEWVVRVWNGWYGEYYLSEQLDWPPGQISESSVRFSEDSDG